MGVSGVGKSTLAQLLAASFDLEFVEADDFHSAANKQRMAAGIPLDDADREPWMADTCAALSTMMQTGSGCVLAHSALQRAHRLRLRQLGFRTLFIHLDGDRELIGQRLGDREDHYMPASLLDSQLESLEDTNDEDDVVRIDVSADQAEISARSSKLIDQFITREIE